MFVHAFGAYFGLAVSYIIEWRKGKQIENSLEEARYTSDIFAMIGKLVPSKNISHDNCLSQEQYSCGCFGPASTQSKQPETANKEPLLTHIYL